MQETRVRSLGWEDPLEMEMVTRSSVLAWEIHVLAMDRGVWQATYSPLGRKESDTTELVLLLPLKMQTPQPEE